MSVSTSTAVGSASPAVEQDRAFGFAAATLIGGGLGVAFFGVLTLISELWVTTQPGLTLSKDVGPLSGKAIFGVTGWLVAWAVLALILRNRNVSENFTYWTTGILVAIGFLLTFPPVWKLLGA
jgi:hypothetical protein